MESQDIEKITAPVAKSIALWGLVGFSSVAEAATYAAMWAGFLAALYSFLLVSEWFWKRLWKPIFRHYGLFGFKRRIMTIEEDTTAKEACE